MLLQRLRHFNNKPLHRVDISDILDDDDDDDGEDLAMDGDDDEDEDEEDEDDDEADEEDEEAPIQMTQKKLDEIIRKRLEQASHKHKAELEEVQKQTKAESKAEALIKSQAARAGMSVDDFIDLVEKNSIRSQLEAESAKTGKSVDELFAMKQLRDENEKLKAEKAKAEELEKANQLRQEATKAEAIEFKEKFPNVTKTALMSDKKFVEFYRNTKEGVTLSAAYESFLKIVGDIRAVERSKAADRIDRSQGSSTKKVPIDETYGLTKTQQKLAKENGMSNKEFAAINARKIK